MADDTKTPEEKLEARLETFPGARYWKSMQASVDAILTPIGEKRRVLSMGTQFVNFDAWTGEKFAHVLCDFFAKNPTRLPDTGEVRDLLASANNARCRDPHIRVARMPERVTLRVARAIIGGGYHEAFHTKYSKRDRVRLSEVRPILDLAEQVILAGGKFDAKMRGLLMTLHHLVEDIRIERRGNEDFEGAKQAMVDLQDFILDLEASARKKGAKVKNVTVSMNGRSIMLCAFRDLGLGYNSHKAQEMIRFYKEHAPGAIALLAPGGILAPMVHEAKTLERDDKMGSLRVAMKIVVELWRVTQQEPDDDEEPAMECPACGASAKHLIIRSVKDDQGVKIRGRAELECKECGFKTEFDLPDNSLNLNQQQKEQDEDQEKPEVEDLDQDDVGEGSDGFGDDTREQMKDQKPQKSDEKQDPSKGSGGNPVPTPGEQEEQEGSDGDDSKDSDSKNKDSKGDQSGEDSDGEAGDEDEGDNASGSGDGDEDEEGDEESTGSSAGQSDENEDGDGPEFEDLDGLVDDGDEEGDDSEGSSSSDGDGEDSEDGESSEGDDGEESDDGDASQDSAEGSSDGEGSDSDTKDSKDGDEGDSEDSDSDTDGDSDDTSSEGGGDDNDFTQTPENQESAEPGDDNGDWEMSGEEFQEGGGHVDLGRDPEGDQELAEEILDGDENDGRMTNQNALDEALADQHARDLRDVKQGEQAWNPYNPMLDEVRIVRSSTPTEDLKTANKMLSEVRSSVSYLRARLRTIVKAQEMTDTAHGVRRGRKLSERMLTNTAIDLRAGRDPKRAYQTRDMQIDTSFDIAICLDQSYSIAMRKIKRPMAQVQMILTDSVDGITGASTFAFGFRNGSRVGAIPEDWSQNFHRLEGVRIDVFKTWEENFTNTKGRFARTHAVGGTPMADGIEFGLHALAGRQAAHRVLAVITDGEPDPGHEPIIRRQIRLADEAGIRIIGIGIGKEAKYVKKLFGKDNAVWAPTVHEMPKELLKKLNELCDFSGRFRGRRPKLDSKGKMTRKVS